MKALGRREITLTIWVVILLGGCLCEGKDDDIKVLDGDLLGRGGTGERYTTTSRVKDEEGFLAAGVGKSGLSFDGRNDFALVREFKNLPRTRITVAAWIKVARHKSYSRILSHEWISWGWNLYCDGAGLVRFGIGQDNKDFAAGRIIFKDKWHYVVGRYDGEYLQAFVDGLPGAKTSLPNAVMDDTGFLSIAGAEYDPFPGQIDEVRIYNVSLSDEDIMRSMVRQPKGDEEGLVAYYKMDEAGGEVLHDETRFKNHARLGKGKRRPLWIQSEAPVSIPCVRAGETVPLILEGASSGRDPPKAFVTSLPHESVGVLHQVNDQGITKPITSVPVEVHAGDGRILFTASGGAPGVDEPRCAAFKYQVHDGKASSAPGTIAVDVVPAHATCDASERAWVETSSRCWRARTEMEHVRPRVLPPTVSIVIPLYNQADLLKETVQSILNQTFTDWEVIIVNDGSTDDGRSVASAKEVILANNRGDFGGLKRRIRLVEKPNGGLADARNAGIQAASGEWIFPLDSDDLIGYDFLERAVALAKGKERRCNLVISDLKGFGAWEYAWHVPEYSARDLKYSNMFHCSALFHKSLWQAVPRGYPIETLFGYEDWAFWIFAEELLDGGISPCYIHEELFFYRIRPNSMHQSLLKNQEYSIASLRMLHPNLFPSELILSSHDKFLGINSQQVASSSPKARSGSVPVKVLDTVEDKVRKFPWSSTLHTVKGLLLEGKDQLREAMDEYILADHLSGPDDWQPKWRLGLVQQRLGLYVAGNETLSGLAAKFEGVSEMYRDLAHLSEQQVPRGSLRVVGGGRGGGREALGNLPHDEL
ncbi:LamGL domain-containing protein [Chloropicon primus]|uniref:LamG-like jellyroll fold domain-containing protein n=1 Tax=Chloropicon primus TaxID=1764295 RepID=A0A5B8MPA3_9CHLO|nr:hypothetical protein A3770_07p48570 [Chloropicon primus]UPR01555.1 LamGL domain-containing protein [Chloropicon primus]|eukprot:QDZ22339.1 hypothetical protein A3770_07p48570 [Chloropicon primus]